MKWPWESDTNAESEPSTDGPELETAETTKAEPPANQGEMGSPDSGEAQAPRDQGGVQVRPVPIPIRHLPEPPSGMDGEDSGEGNSLRGSSKLIYHLPSRICKSLFGFKDDLGQIKYGFLTKRYSNRADELILDKEECDFVDDAFARPLLKLIKLIGLSSDEIFMIVIGITILLPRAGVVLDEEIKRNKGAQDLLTSIHGAGSQTVEAPNA